MVEGGGWMIGGGWWRVDDRLWIVDGGWWRVDCGWWMVGGGWWRGVVVVMRAVCMRCHGTSRRMALSQRPGFR